MKAQNKTEFKEAWKSQVNQIALLYWSLPREKKGDLIEAIDKIKVLIDTAAKYSYPEDS